MHAECITDAPSAGDLGVTPIIQCAASMIISSSLVHTDLHHRAIRPLPFVWPHVQHLPDPHYIFDRIFRSRAKRRALEAKRKAAEAGLPEGVENCDYWENEKHGFKFYFWMLVRFAFEGTEMNMLFERCGFGEWWLRLLWTAAQGALLGIIFGIPCWCLAIIILGPIYRGHNMGNKWAPQAIKGVYGCIVGWITNPIIASLALGGQSEHHLLVVPDDKEAQTEGLEGQTPAIATIAEEELVNGTPVESLNPPSPFLRPFRPVTSPGPGLSAASSPGGSPGRSRTQSFNRPNRSRAGSVGSAPFTANVANLGPPSPIVPGLSPSRLTPQRPTGRPRGYSTTAAPGAPGPFSYALGGVGGRARRGRSNTTTTAVSDIGLAKPRKPFADNASPTPGARPGSAASTTDLDLAPPAPHHNRERTLSDVAGGATHQAWAEKFRQSLDAGEAPYGEARPDVPQFRVQRPSMEGGLEPPFNYAEAGAGSLNEKGADPYKEYKEK